MKIMEPAIDKSDPKNKGSDADSAPFFQYFSVFDTLITLCKVRIVPNLGKPLFSSVSLVAHDIHW